jgi:uncharacterized protein (DUF427 family)
MQGLLGNTGVTIGLFLQKNLTSDRNQSGIILVHLLIAKTKKGVRVIETASAPTYYIAPEDLRVGVEPSGHESFCEWKGVGESLNVLGQSGAGWRYVRVFEEFSRLANWVSFYPSKLDCFVGKEKVRPQPGGFYGGWVTDMLTGPIKGAAESGGW